MRSNWIATMLLTAALAAFALQQAEAARAANEPSMHAMASMPEVVSSLHQYVVPSIVLIDQHGRKVPVNQAFAGTRPVLVQFFFSSCTTICGVRSAQLVAIAPILASDGINIELYSVSIDPNEDTPKRLLAYSKRFGPPPPRWHLLTGSVSEVRQLQAAFDASDPSADIMMHRSLTFIHAGTNQPWMRIDGVTSGNELVHLIKTAVSAAD